MSEDKPAKTMDQVIAEDGRYAPEAFAFLSEGMARAQREAYGDETEGPGQRHVTGQQVCAALRELALERWGMLARTVLAKWGVRGTIDFGNMVYLLIENDLNMRKTDEDSIEDFRDVFDFDETFGGGDDFELRE